jgi:hypothetical protein
LIFGRDRRGSVTVQMASGTAPELAALDLERVLRRDHRLRPEP